MDEKGKGRANFLPELVTRRGILGRFVFGATNPP